MLSKIQLHAGLKKKRETEKPLKDHWLKSYLSDAVEAAHERVQRVEETQDVVQVPGQSRVFIHK